MKELVIGADGLVGSRLKELARCDGTSRRVTPGCIPFDLMKFTECPTAQVIYMCAGANGARNCEGRQDAFIRNVDVPIKIAQNQALRGGFFVWISSMSIEWMDGAYQRHKLAAESVLRVMPNVATIRAGRITRDKLDNLCEEMMRVGRGKISGVHRWGHDESGYSA